MGYNSILTFIDKTASIESLKPVMEKVGEANLHLSVHVLEIAPPNPYYAYGFSPYGGMDIPDSWQDEVKAGADTLAALANTVEKAVQTAGISASVTTSYCEKAVVDIEVAKPSYVNDIAVLPRQGAVSEEIWQGVLSGVLFRSPVGVIVPNNLDQWPLNPKQVFVAWNTGLEAMRAIHQALPMLKAAKKVTLGIFDPVLNQYGDGEDPGTDIAAWLSRHGCKVDVQQYPGGGIEIGEAIQKRAMDVGAELVVMGAYQHSRIRQNIFGGTTATMLTQKKLPVFFAH
jgi:nucleotide-binding universal stress UspA family protein